MEWKEKVWGFSCDWSEEYIRDLCELHRSCFFLQTYHAMGNICMMQDDATATANAVIATCVLPSMTLRVCGERRRFQLGCFFRFID